MGRVRAEPGLRRAAHAVRLAADVGLDVDRRGLGTAARTARLGVVDRAGELVDRQRVIEVDLGGDQQVVGTEVHRAQVDDGCTTCGDEASACSICS